MVNKITDNNHFYKAICQDELVYLFGAGISGALTGKPCGWFNWIMDGIELISDIDKAEDLKVRLAGDVSADNMINIVGELSHILKSEGSYMAWMQQSFESNDIVDSHLAEILKKFFVMNDVVATTNYDRLLEKSTGMGSVTYEEPDKVFEMLKYKRLKAVLHIHGMFDSYNGIDNIIADNEQYKRILDNKGAQFLQNLLGTRTVIFICCGKTTDDVNISQFIRFSQEWLKLDINYYFLHDENANVDDLPNNTIPICYGRDYSFLPAFLEEMINERLKANIEKQRIVGRSIFTKKSEDIYGLTEYHYAKEYIKFCGRKKELGRLESFLENDAPFLWWAITGQAGAGKSRLSYELIQRLPHSYFGFFINPSAKLEEAKKFIPFSDTLVIFDYVKGNEKAISKIVIALSEKFREDDYDGFKLRILFVERERLTISGTWYDSLESAFSYYDRVTFVEAEYIPYLSSSSHDFIYIDDLDNDAVLELIEDICEKNRLPKDELRNQKLFDSYANKFEQLRFRPLFVHIYVQAWIENGASDIDYRNYRELINAVLDKEEEHLIKAVNGDKGCCASLIRLLIRASVTPLVESDIPTEYKADWMRVRKFVEDNSLPGIERKQELISLVKDASQSIDTDICAKEYVIDPMYPDIIKEAFFLRYVDDMEVFGTELWIESSLDYSMFLYRCAIDYPDDIGLRNYIQSQTITYNSIPAMYARISLLHHEIVSSDDDAKQLQEDIDEEYRYWLSVPTEGDNAEELMAVRIEGLHDSLLMFAGWSNAGKVKESIENLSDSPDNLKLREIKCRYLLDMAKYFTEGGVVSVGMSEYTLDTVGSLIEPIEDNIEFIHYARLVILSYRIINSVLLVKVNTRSGKYNESDWEAIYDMVSKLETYCDQGDEHDMEQYAYTIYYCTTLAMEKLAGGNINSFSYILQDYAIYAAQNSGKVAFNDKIHYYYLHSKYIETKAVCISSSLAFGNCDYANDIVDGYIEEIENNEMIRDFSGLLVGAWALKVGIDDALLDEDVTIYLEKAREYIILYPDNSLLVEKYFDLLSSAVTYQYKRKANKTEIDYCYSLALRFPAEKGVLREFFELLGKSSERSRWSYILRTKVSEQV